mmetsp:Transcript_8490/g.24923  ORF Transcript_8490/g.24923 Transcript_8490/m.24923 type:complete len:220 (+) Transcript_8490:654-1313(+)
MSSLLHRWRRSNVVSLLFSSSSSSSFTRCREPASPSSAIFVRGRGGLFASFFFFFFFVAASAMLLLLLSFSSSFSDGVTSGRIDVRFVRFVPFPARVTLFLFPFAEADNGIFFVFASSVATPTLFLLVPFFFFFTNSVSSSSSSSSSFLLSLFLLLFFFFFAFSLSSSSSRGRILTTTVVWFPIFIVLPFLNVLASECSSNSTSSTYVPFELPRSTMTH